MPKPNPLATPFTPSTPSPTRPVSFFTPTTSSYSSSISSSCKNRNILATPITPAGSVKGISTTSSKASYPPTQNSSLVGTMGCTVTPTVTAVHNPASPAVLATTIAEKDLQSIIAAPESNTTEAIIANPAPAEVLAGMFPVLIPAHSLPEFLGANTDPSELQLHPFGLTEVPISTYITGLSVELAYARAQSMAIYKENEVLHKKLDMLTEGLEMIKCDRLAQVETLQRRISESYRDLCRQEERHKTDLARLKKVFLERPLRSVEGKFRPEEQEKGEHLDEMMDTNKTKHVVSGCTKDFSSLVIDDMDAEIDVEMFIKSLEFEDCN